jgi:5-methylcytosine-specific restriction endonuclease McrA
MANVEKLVRAAESDTSFALLTGYWVGKCLICNGPIAFNARTGEGATLEHIRARTRGGTQQLENLAVVHGRCNWEKGQRWDGKRRRRESEYEAFIERLIDRRKTRWRDRDAEAAKFRPPSGLGRD